MTVPARRNLYRKYRPQRFSELAGQEHISKTIQSAVATNRISHAYMFSGPRGTGKTSSARLLAKILNCTDLQKDKNGLLDCCGTCDNCRRIEEMAFMDIVEIDAASNNGVEDIRQMREKVKYKPVEGKYKVYIIDEVHMLSGSAFNAFLKTLEEPPENVIFVLATTDPQKVPATIISRCQCFDFHSVSRRTIQNRLEEIVRLEAKEGNFPNFEPESLAVIADCAEGGFRDALSILDQISSSSTLGKITLDYVLEMTRRLGYSTLKKISEAVFKHALSESLRLLNELYLRGYEPLTIGRDLLEYLRRCMILKIDPNANQVLDLPVEQVGEILEQVKDLSVRYLIGCVSRVERILMTLRSSTQAQILLESEIIKLALGDEIFASEAIEKRIEHIEQSVAGLKRIALSNQLSGKADAGFVQRPAPETPPYRPLPSKDSNAFVPAGSTIVQANSVKTLSNDLTLLRKAVGQKSKVISSFMITANIGRSKDGVLTLVLGQSFACQKLKEEKSLGLILESAKKIWPDVEKVNVVLAGSTQFNSDSQQETKYTPTFPIDMKEEISKIDEEAKQRVKEISQVADALDVFGGDVVKIEPR